MGDDIDDGDDDSDGGGYVGYDDDNTCWKTQKQAEGLGSWYTVHSPDEDAPMIIVTMMMVTMKMMMVMMMMM